MTARTSTDVKRAFKRFVELVKPIEDVRYVVAFDEEELDIYTYIDALDEAVMSRVHHVEMQLMDEFPTLLVDFHVRYLEGRPLEAFTSPLPGLTYVRGNGDDVPGKVES